MPRPCNFAAHKTSAVAFVTVPLVSELGPLLALTLAPQFAVRTPKIDHRISLQQLKRPLR
jgi:hypothetical protein